MALTNTADRWGGIAKTLHWLMALMLVGALAVGTVMADWPDDETAIKSLLRQMHESVGMLLLALVLLRLSWRALQPVPPSRRDLGASPARLPRSPTVASTR